MNIVSSSLVFHDYAESYPLLGGAEYEAFKADIARGVREPVKYRVVNGEKQGLDGRNRLRACEDLGIPCPEEEVSVADEDVEDYIDSLNLHRRHLTRDQQRERIARKLKADPAQSNLKIAKETQASDKTVAAVREELESRSEIPNVETRKDSKGRNQPAHKAAPVLCKRCQRVGAVADCPRCAEAREARGIDANGRKPKRKRPKAPQKAEVTDALGNAVPDHLRDVFADTQLAEMIATLEGLFAQFTPEPWVEKAGKLCDHHGFILISKFREHLYDGLARIQLATEALIAGLPHAVCPKCQGVDSNTDGKTCRGCRGHGAVPKHRYEELTRA